MHEFKGDEVGHVRQVRGSEKKGKSSTQHMTILIYLLVQHSHSLCQFDYACRGIRPRREQANQRGCCIPFDECGRQVQSNRLDENVTQVLCNKRLRMDM